MKLDFLGRAPNHFWAVVNWRNEVWANTADYSRTGALKKFAAEHFCGNTSWRAARRRGFKLVWFKAEIIERKTLGKIGGRK